MTVRYKLIEIILGPLRIGHVPRVDGAVKRSNNILKPNAAYPPTSTVKLDTQYFTLINVFIETKLSSRYSAISLFLINVDVDDSFTFTAHELHFQN